MEYNKLVRDKIPRIIFSEGRIPIFEYITEKDKLKFYLEKKLKEEVDEYFSETEDRKLPELYDIVEVCLAIAKNVYNKNRKQFNLGRTGKNKGRGAFEKPVLLKSVEE